MSLLTRISKSFKSTKFDTRPDEFLPQSAISELVDRDAIIRELWEPGKDLTDDDKNLVQWIQNDAPQLFLTMIYSRTPDIDSCSRKCMSMKLFRKHDLSDDRLPLTHTVDFLCTPSTDDEERNCRNIWNEGMEFYFKPSQWKFVVPVISSTKFTYSLQPGQILPFTVVDDVVKGGAFGRVYRVKIHPSHIDHDIGEVRAVFKITAAAVCHDTLC